MKPITTRNKRKSGNTAMCAITLAFGSALLLNTNVSATVSTGKDKTTCYVFKHDKLVKKAACGFEATVGGSTGYGFSDYDFSIKGFGDIGTYSHVNAQTDAKGEPLVNPDGSMKDPRVVISINKKPAIARYRQATTYKRMSQDEVRKDYEKHGNSKAVLSCIAATDKSLEICVPLTKADLEHG